MTESLVKNLFRYLDVVRENWNGYTDLDVAGANVDVSRVYKDNRFSSVPPPPPMVIWIAGGFLLRNWARNRIKLLEKNPSSSMNLSWIARSRSIVLNSGTNLSNRSRRIDTT